MRWLRLFFLLLVLPLAACAVNQASYTVDTAGPYRLNTGDVLRVTVYGDTSLSTTYKVDDSGAVAFPLVGPVQVAGVTTDVAAKRISAALARGYMRNPNVAVEVADYRPFFIQGEVTTSGQFPYVYGMTARAAISSSQRRSLPPNRSSSGWAAPIIPRTSRQPNVRASKCRLIASSGCA